MAWYERFLNFFSQNDCQKYYEAVMMDPALEVTPTLVLSDMISSFLLHPCGKLGSAVADFSNNILGKLYHALVNLSYFVI
jgi:hypothetical protein